MGLSSRGRSSSASVLSCVVDMHSCYTGRGNGPEVLLKHPNWGAVEEKEKKKKS